MSAASAPVSGAADATAVAPLAGVRPGVPERLFAAALGLPLLLLALAIGIGSDVPAWVAPWALVGALGFLVGDRAGGVAGAGAAVVAIVLGPVAVIGVAGGIAVGALGRRARPALAIGSAALTMAATLALLATA